MQPFYFGSSHRQLFGAYHAPEAGREKRAGVVLCHPLGHEYLRAHRAFRNLAALLAAQGLHVLRFDYFGSGDSGGDDAEMTMEQCLADIDTAIDELKDTAGIARVSLVGLRLGATFAALTAARRGDVDRLILWDPVSDGAAYLDELLTLQRGWLCDRLGERAVGLAGDGELIGFSATSAVRAQLKSLTLSSVPRTRARAVALMVSDERPSYELLHRAFVGSGAAAACDLVREPAEWTSVDQVHQILLPHAMVRAIAAALSS